MLTRKKTEVRALARALIQSQSSGEW